MNIERRLKQKGFEVVEKEELAIKWVGGKIVNEILSAQIEIYQRFFEYIGVSTKDIDTPTNNDKNRSLLAPVSQHSKKGFEEPFSSKPFLYTFTD
ncbi:hypothetical protein AAIE21_27415 [Paenibacillus sp. 102]|uniref:hypothetical protein n=1 Tax=Paenibacillus sp. 102 TaxID=3120823 RepID=UPI0031BB4FD8